MLLASCFTPYSSKLAFSLLTFPVQFHQYIKIHTSKAFIHLFLFTGRLYVLAQVAAVIINSYIYTLTSMHTKTALKKKLIPNPSCEDNKIIMARYFKNNLE
jgi:hypothetical protein